MGVRRARAIDALAAGARVLVTPGQRARTPSGSALTVKGVKTPIPRSNRSWRPRADATSLVTATRPLWLVGLRRLYHYSMFVLLVGAVIALATLLDTDGKVVALKIFVIAYFSLLPAILYLQFTSRKTPTVWREYVLTLFRLHADDYAYLPEPPKPSRYPWGA